MAKKITKATLKSFIRKNRENLFIKCNSDFDGMVDCVVSNENAEFMPVSEPANPHSDHDLGIRGLWLVGQSRDYFSHFENDEFIGIEISNSCGNQTIAIKK